MTQTDTTDAAATSDQPTQAKRKRRMAREPLSQEVSALEFKKPAEPRTTKASVVETLLCRDGGAALYELCQATGWQPHTCRAFLTGLRKRGHAIEKAKGDDGVTRWSVSAAAAA
jgi:hypothetical protein